MRLECRGLDLFLLVIGQVLFKGMSSKNSFRLKLVLWNDVYSTYCNNVQTDMLIRACCSCVSLDESIREGNDQTRNACRKHGYTFTQLINQDVA